MNFESSISHQSSDMEFLTEEDIAARRKRRRLIIAGVVALVLLVAGYVMFGRGSGNGAAGGAADKQAPHITVVVPGRTSVTNVITATGSLGARREMPVCVHPSWSVVAAGGLAVAHRGLQEYEIVDLGGRLWLGLTLVRSVGWLSRRDLVTRGVGAGPDLAVPGAQCLGPDHAEFRIAAVGEDDGPAALALARALRQPALALRGHGAWRPAFEVGEPRLQVSSLRRIGMEDELRLWNPGAQALQASGLAGWRRVRADGAPAAAGLEVGPHAIATFRRPR